MKADDLLKAIDKIDERFIDEAFPQKYNGDASASDETGEQNVIKLSEVSSKSRFKIAASIAACICISVVGIIIALNTVGVFDHEQNDQKVHTASSEKSGPAEVSDDGSSQNCYTKKVWNDESSGEYGSIVGAWDEISLNKQYTKFKFNDINYESAEIYAAKKIKVSTEDLGDSLGTTVISGQDTYTNKIYKKNIDIFSIKGISVKRAVAVRFAGNDDYYIYRNSNYKSETLGKFINDLGLKENMLGSVVTYELTDNYADDLEIVHNGLNETKIWKMLLSNGNLKNDEEYSNYLIMCIAKSSECYFPLACIELDVPNYDTAIWITDDGYVCSIPGSGDVCSFYIGKDNVQEFIEYVKKDCKAYENIQNSNNEKSSVSTVSGNINRKQD